MKLKTFIHLTEEANFGWRKSLENTAVLPAFFFFLCFNKLFINDNCIQSILDMKQFNPFIESDCEELLSVYETVARVLWWLEISCNGKRDPEQEAAFM